MKINSLEEFRKEREQRILKVLRKDREPVYQMEIARRLNEALTPVAKTLRRMEEKGFLEKVPFKNLVYWRLVIKHRKRGPRITHKEQPCNCSVCKNLRQIKYPKLRGRQQKNEQSTKIKRTARRN